MAFQFFFSRFARRATICLNQNVRTKLSLLCALIFLATPRFAFAFDGLVVSELPPGGDVTVPGDYPIMVPRRVDVLVSGISNPQSMSLTNTTTSTSIVQIYAQHEKKVRVIRLQPGTSAVYSFKNVRPVRVKVTTGDVRISSIQPLKVQR